MMMDVFNELLDQRPFVPFDLRLPHGEMVPVEHPEFVLMFPDENTVAIKTPKIAEQKSRLRIVNLAVVSEYEVRLTRPQ